MIQFVKSKGLECRFSSEDSFRSDLVDLLNIYSIVAKAGVDRYVVNFICSKNQNIAIYYKYNNVLIELVSQIRLAVRAQDKCTILSGHCVGSSNATLRHSKILLGVISSCLRLLLESRDMLQEQLGRLATHFTRTIQK